ncbi:4-hydroxy-tetrahydrodipicolinate synthase [[Clostridium] colinum]|uniref:4-hydroxy-tetrahydrodipicolinate synthase n=1 Tax=[Clostridium] colinum TaxID=36835 RepID=UPI002ED2C5F6
MSIFTGSGVAIVTPFKEDKTIDFQTFEKLINFQIENGTDAIIVCGTTGEPSTLTNEERFEVIKFCVEKVAKRVPVIAGAGSNNTKQSVELCKRCEQIGVDGLLIVTPYYNKTTQKGIINHYKILAESVNLPIIIYNVPSRTGLNMTPKTVLELSKIDNIVGIKEASGNISQIVEIASICPKDFYIYSGNDNQILPILSIGGKGVISVMANIIPKDTHNIIEKFLNGEFEESKDLQLSVIELNNALFCEVSPIPIKTALELMGYGKAYFREPLVDMEEDDVIVLKNAMKNYKLIK